MPPKEDPKLKLAASEKNSVVTNGSKDESVKSSQVAAKSTVAQKVINPNDLFAQAEGGAKTSHGTPPTVESAANASTTERPQDVDMEDATVRDKVGMSAKELERLFHEYGDQLIKGTQEVLQQAKGADAQSAQAINSTWSRVKKQFKPKLNTCLNRLVESIPNDPEDGVEQDTVHPRIDFGRDSDYDQAMQTQQALASERDDLQLQLEGYRQQVEHLKAAEADLFDQCKELEEKFSRAQVDLVPCQYKAGILETVTEFLKTDHTNVMDTLGQVMHKMRSLEKQIAEFESHEDAGRIAELESQLRNEQGANMKMRRTIAEHEKQLASGSAGAGKSLVECAQEIGFIRDASGKLLLGPPASRGFDYSKPYAYTNRTLDVLEMFAKNQSVHALPPLKTFLGDYKEDKISLPEFLKMFKRSWRRKKGI
ncbi:hypothetical protein AAVH_12778 [Aphelenchoides avenae]|nr:hypothetical protein AAVH_12778 [Aphelenchus avenae]